VQVAAQELEAHHVHVRVDEALRRGVRRRALGGRAGRVQLGLGEDRAPVGRDERERVPEPAVLARQRVHAGRRVVDREVGGRAGVADHLAVRAEEVAGLPVEHVAAEVGRLHAERATASTICRWQAFSW
jgi:hypothetical protein